MENKTLTAVEWFCNKLSDLDTRPRETLQILEWYEQAKQMEKEQTENAFQESRLAHPMIGFKHQTFEQYYNETYNK
jgi:hypothetical protein